MVKATSSHNFEVLKLASITAQIVSSESGTFRSLSFDWLEVVAFLTSSDNRFR